MGTDYPGGQRLFGALVRSSQYQYLQISVLAVATEQSRALGQGK